MKKENQYKTRIEEFGNLKPGDRIVGSDGQPVTVTDVYEKHYPDTMYEIEMEDGEVVQASGNHLWYCESEIDENFKEEYLRLAKKFFENKVVPEKLTNDSFSSLDETITLFGDEVDTQLLIESACRSLGYSRVGPHLIIEDKYAIKEIVHYYSYNNLIEFLNKMRQAVLEDKGYFYFGEVRTTDEIAKLMSHGVKINIPHRKDVGQDIIKDW